MNQRIVAHSQLMLPGSYHITWATHPLICLAWTWRDSLYIHHSWLDVRLCFFRRLWRREMVILPTATSTTNGERVAMWWRRHQSVSTPERPREGMNLNPDCFRRRFPVHLFVASCYFSSQLTLLASNDNLPCFLCGTHYNPLSDSALVDSSYYCWACSPWQE